MTDSSKKNQDQHQEISPAKLDAEVTAIEEQAASMKKAEQADVGKKNTIKQNLVSDTDQIKQIRSKTTLLSAAILILAIAGAGGAWYLNQNLQQAVNESSLLKISAKEAQDHSERLLTAFSEQNQRIEDLLASNEKLKKENQDLKSVIDGQISSLSTRLDNAEKGLGTASAELKRYEDRNPDDWKLAQAYFLVNSAFQTAVFQSDATSAIWCLKDADAMLINIEDPDVIKVRKAIASDLLKLANLPSVDKRGILFKIDSVCENLNTMTLNGLDGEFSGNKSQINTQLQKDPANWKENLWNSVKNFSSKFIEIRRRDEQALSDFLSSSQAQTLQENIRALLLLSKQALIQSDPQAFRSNIEQSINLIKKYYDPSGDTFKANLDALESVKDLQISVDVPSVLSSYSVFREIASSRIRIISPSTDVNKQNTTQASDGDDNSSEQEINK
ncbi:MAG: uroporphyrinogen-III C-methyltransferase [Succinatimonas sp.]|nr:uroporphyrinogen-III C-methyltransferase [Succinatimonas sp.]